MNLHCDSPIWRRRGFRKCLKKTQQQRAVSCRWELHWDKLDLSAVLVSAWRWADSNPDMTQILISIGFWKILLCTIFFIFYPFCFPFSPLKSIMVHYSSFFSTILYNDSSVFPALLYFKSLVVLRFFPFLMVMLHPSKKSDHILNGVQTLKLISWIVFWWSVTLCSFCIKKQKQKNMNWKSWSKYQAIFLL